MDLLQHTTMDTGPRLLRFAVEFEDNSSQYIFVGLERPGAYHEVARTVAADYQRRGKLPNKRIRHVRRSPV